MDLAALAQQAINILVPAMPFVYVGKDAVVDKVKDMLLEKGIEKLGSKSMDRAKALFDKIKSQKSESLEVALREVSTNSEDPKAKEELQQEILKLLRGDPNLAREIERTINLNVENVDQLAVGITTIFSILKSLLETSISKSSNLWIKEEKKQQIRKY